VITYDDQDLDKSVLDSCIDALMRRPRGIEQLQLTVAGGDGEKVLSLFHENFLDLPVDGGLNRWEELYEWLMLSDQLQTHARGFQAFHLLKYQSAAATAFAHTCRCVGRPHLQLPRLEWERRTKTSQLQTVASSVLACMHPFIRPYYCISSVVQELGSILVRAAAPSVRPVAPALLSERERVAIAHAARLLSVCGITLRNASAQGGGATFLFEPAIDALVAFEGQPAPRQAPYSVQQMIAQTARNDMLRREDRYAFCDLLIASNIVRQFCYCCGIG